MEKVLVTGGAGFIGSHLCERLLKDDTIQKLVVLDNFLLGTEQNVTHLKQYARFELIEHDVNDLAFLNSQFQKNNFDTVFHLAANSDISISHSNPNIDFANTFAVTWNLLEAMRINECKNLVFASTSAIYGDTQDDIHENYGPLKPISHYGAGKLASEAFIFSFSYNYNINTYIFRFPNVVGGKSTHGIIYDFLRKLKNNPDTLEVLGNGKQEKSYLHVSDLIDAIIFCKNKFTDLTNIFNVGGIDTITVKRISEIVLEETNSPHILKFTGGDRGWVGDVPKFRYNIEKIKSTGWKPKYNSEMAIRKAVNEMFNQK